MRLLEMIIMVAAGIVVGYVLARAKRSSAHDFLWVPTAVKKNMDEETSWRTDEVTVALSRRLRRVCRQNTILTKENERLKVMYRN